MKLPARSAQTVRALACLTYILLSSITVNIFAQPTTIISNGHGPRFVHQPANVLVQAGKPHTIECPVEGEPEPEIKWFKNGHLLASRPPHLEQAGNELMFIAMGELDAGEYHCQASNPLATITSDRFKLAIQTSFHDSSMSFEPRLATVQADHLVAFTCTLSQLNKNENEDTNSESGASPQLNQQPQVFFRKNGQALPVRWVESSLNLGPENLNQIRSLGERYLARALSPVQYQLLIVGTSPDLDHNSTFSCLYKQTEPANSQSELDSASNQQLAHESNGVELRVLNNSHQVPLDARHHHSNSNNKNDNKNDIKLDVDLGPPIADLANWNGPHQIIPPVNNDTTRAASNATATGSISLLSSSNASYLYEVLKPALLVGAIFVLIANTLLWAQWTLGKWRRRVQYKKHHQHQHLHHHSAGHQHHHYSAGSGSSGASSMLGSSFECDPVLKSLMGRTLSGGGGGANQLAFRNSSSSLVNNASKKYRSYRDHLRCKVAAIGNNDLIQHSSGNQQQQQQPFNQQRLAADLVDGLLHYQANPVEQHQQLIASQSSNLPNLYNQSLAAREQARSLLQQVNEQSAHMRSLNNIYTNSNTNNHHQLQPQSATRDFLQRLTGLRSSGGLVSSNQNKQHQNYQPMMPGSQLNLHSPATTTLFGNQQEDRLWTTTANNINSNNGKHNANVNVLAGKQVFRPNHLSSDGQQTLVNCQLSASSNESSAHSPSSLGSSGIGPGKALSSGKMMQQQRQKLPHQSVSSSNHYSVIDAQANDEVGYQLEDDDQEDCYEELDHHQQQQANVMQINSNHNNHDQNQNQASRNSSTRTTSTFVSGGLTLDSLTNQAQPSAPSSFSKRAAKSQQQHAQDQLSPYAVSSIVCSSSSSGRADEAAPPPMTSEAIRALNEQFNINQLMLLDEVKLDAAGDNADQCD